MKKIVLIAACFICAMTLNVFAKPDIVTDISDDETVVLYSADEEYELSEYENQISIVSDTSTISEAGGTLQLTAVIENPLSAESVVWSIESGKNYATIDQNGLVKAVTNGVVVCKAKSTVDASRFAYKTIIISIQTEKKWAHLDLMGVGCTFRRRVGDQIKTIGGYQSTDYLAGTQFDLEAVPKTTKVDGADVATTEFLYWKGSDGRVVSYDPVYKFTLGTDMKLTAVCASVTGSSRHVVFKDISGKILSEGPTTSTITIPSEPFALGYEFYCWVADGKEYDFTARTKFDTSGISKNTIFTAGYVKAPVKYNLSVTGAKEGGGKYYYNDFISLHAAETEEGRKFAYWKRDGKIISYDSTYEFYMGAHDSCIEAVFADTDEPVALVPIIILDEPMIVDTNKISFTAERYLPEQYTLVATGIIMDNSTANITLDTYGVKNSMASSNANTGKYTIRKKDIAANETWYARAYMIYADKDNIITISKSL